MIAAPLSNQYFNGGLFGASIIEKKETSVISSIGPVSIVWSFLSVALPSVQ